MRAAILSPSPIRSSTALGEPKTFISMGVSNFLLFFLSIAFVKSSALLFALFTSMYAICGISK
ncbi:hypothetical protein D1872_316990 [compost metagenome]